MRGRHPDTWSQAARRLRGPLYAVVDAGAAYQGGFSSSDHDVSLTVEHRDGHRLLTVTTDDAAPWMAGEDAVLLSQWAHAALGECDPTFPVTLTADRWEQQVPVDGRAVTFTVVGGSGAWVAAADVDGREVLVSATGWDSADLRLHAVPPSAVLHEPRDGT